VCRYAKSEEDTEANMQRDPHAVVVLKQLVPSADRSFLLAAYLMYRRWTRILAQNSTTTDDNISKSNKNNTNNNYIYLPPHNMTTPVFLLTALRIIIKFVQGADESICTADNQLECAALQEVEVATIQTASAAPPSPPINNPSALLRRKTDLQTSSSTTAAVFHPPWGQWEKYVLQIIDWRISHYVKAAEYMLKRQKPIRVAPTTKSSTSSTTATRTVQEPELHPNPQQQHHQGESKSPPLTNKKTIAMASSQIVDPFDSGHDVNKGQYSDVRTMVPANPSMVRI